VISAQGLRQRASAARERLRAIPATGRGEYGAPDPETGERWNRGNVLGHLAEMVAACRGKGDSPGGSKEGPGKGKLKGPCLFFAQDSFLDMIVVGKAYERIARSNVEVNIG